MENYYIQDAEFQQSSTFSYDDLTSAYLMETADKTQRYFAADGRLLGIVDRFDNQIKFKYVEQPVTNYAPNSDFEVDETHRWEVNSYYSYDNGPSGVGKDDNSSLKFVSNSSGTFSSLSDYIPVLPSTKYYLSGYLYDQTSNVTSSLVYRQYDSNGTEIGTGTVAGTDQNTGSWELIETANGFITDSNASYVRIEFRNSTTNTNSIARLDKVRFDRLWPLISEISDCIGRTITFNYTDTLYEDSTSNAGAITVIVTDPAATASIIFTYNRGIYHDNYSWPTNWSEQRRFPRLDSFDNGETTSNYEYKNPPAADLFSFDPNALAATSRSLLMEYWYLPNSRIKYEYESTTKHLGATGYYETHRIVNRHIENKVYDPGQQQDIYSGTDYRRTYSYSGSYNGNPYDNETGYPDNLADNPDFEFASTMQQDNNLVVQHRYKGGKEDSTVKTHSNGEQKTTTFKYENNSFPNLITETRIDRYLPGQGTTTLYMGYTYNNWGGIAAETRSLTPAQWTDPAVKNLHTVSYTYDATFKFRTSRSYYQQPGTLLTESTTYDPTYGRITATTNARSQVTEYHYTTDPQDPYVGNVRSITVNLGGGQTKTTEFDYSGADHAWPTTITAHSTDPDTGQDQTSVTVKEYEFIRGNVKTIDQRENPAIPGNITTYDYDDLGRVTSIIHPASAGKNGEYTVEENYDYIASTLMPETNQYAFQVVATQYQTPTGGSATLFTESANYYDDFGNLQVSRYHDLDRQEWLEQNNQFNDYGQLILTEDARGNPTSLISDEWGRLQRVTDAQGNQVVYEYDSYNRTKTIKFNPVSNPGIYENHYIETFDQWGRLISRKGYPDGLGQPAVQETYDYDLVGNLIQQTDARNNTTLFQYDELNKLTRVTNALGEEVDYDYNRLGNLQLIAQYQGASSFLTTYQYDERGLLLSKQPPAGNPTTYRYNALGLPVQVTDASGMITTMQYDGANRLTEIQAIHDGITQYYSPLGLVEKYEAWNDATGSRVYGEELNYNFYSTGLTKQRTTASFDVNFQYDQAGNRTRVTDPFNLAVNYLYDSLNRLDSITVGTKTFDYEYYDDGMLKAVIYPTLTGGAVLKTKYTYDNINRLTTLQNLKDTQVITEYSYDYDDNGNITAITETGVGTTIYQYDALNRLTGTQRPNGEIIYYQYDTRGNRTQAEINTGDLPEFIPGDFNFNNWGQVASFTTSGSTYDYQYDQEGLRTRKTGPGESIRYHYDNYGRVIAESDANNQIIAQIIWGHKALARVIDGLYYYYLYNGHGDVVRVMDQVGNIVNSYSYDEWGNILAQQEQIANPLKYAGEYYDPESGLYYLRARYYDPTIGRFISQDAIEGMITNPLSLNLYTYGYNNSLRYIDPSGHAVTAWDEAHLSNDELTELRELTDAWDEANTDEQRAAVHARAEELRDQYRDDNEVGRDDGYTVDKNTGGVIIPYVDDDNDDETITPMTVDSTIRKAVDEFDGEKARQDLWSGMSSQGWTPYFNTAYTVVNAHSGVAVGLAMEILPSWGDPNFDKAYERLSYATLYSPSKWINAYKATKKFIVDIFN